MPEKIDFGPLALNDIRREQLIAAVMTGAQGELERRRMADLSLFTVLSGWARPAFAAAAVLAVVCVSMLTYQSLDGTPGSGIADALAVPAPAVAWLVGDRSPTVDDLMIAMEEDN